MKPVKPAAEKPDPGRATAAMGLAAQIDQHAQARRNAPKGSAEWHSHHQAVHEHMSQLQRVDSTLHATVMSVVALEDRLHQSKQVSSSLDPDARRERAADPNRREAIARDRANLRSAKDMFQQRTSAGVAKPAAPKPRGKSLPKDTQTLDEWKSQNG